MMSLLKQINYYEVKYENLVENLETTVKSLLKFLELPWTLDKKV